MTSLLDAEEIPTYNQRREVTKGLLQIASGVGTLLLLCALGPAIITYATAAGFPLVVLTILVSVLIAGWDVGGLLLILVGIRRLIK
jgi:hypothetical protein